MPNWVFNGLTIEGNKDQVNKLIEQMNTPFVGYVERNGDLAYSVSSRKYPNPVFAFRNIIAPTDIDAYLKQPEFDATKPMYTGDDWYNWNNRNWGTKWDVANQEGSENTYMEEWDNGENKVVYYNFDTAWSAPFAAIEKLSAQYPTLLFSLSYKEEGGWGGEAEYLRGVEISVNQYDNKCEACEYEYTDQEASDKDECEDCYTVCPRCGFSYELCQTHLLEYQTKQEAK